MYRRCSSTKQVKNQLPRELLTEIKNHWLDIVITDDDAVMAMVDTKLDITGMFNAIELLIYWVKKDQAALLLSECVCER